MDAPVYGLEFLLHHLGAPVLGRILWGVSFVIAFIYVFYFVIKARLRDLIRDMFRGALWDEKARVPIITMCLMVSIMTFVCRMIIGLIQLLFPENWDGFVE